MLINILQCTGQSSPPPSLPPEQIIIQFKMLIVLKLRNIGINCHTEKYCLLKAMLWTFCRLCFHLCDLFVWKDLDMH